MNQREIKFKVWWTKTKAMEQIEGWAYIDQRGELLIAKPLYSPRPAPEKGIVLFYIGLKDKNGKEIYWADILKDNAGQVYEIKWLEEQGQICAVRVDSELNGWPRHFRDIQFMEVIGNIYENKDLLK